MLLKNSALVKSVGFKNHRYIGDPIIAVRIFNELKADELIFLDIEASKENRLISLDFVRAVGEEADMPFAVGGGIKTLEDIRGIINAGAEKVVVTTKAAQDPDFIYQAAETFGSSTIVACIDVKKKLFKGQRVWASGGNRATEYSPLDFARLMEEKGAGEIIVQSIERDGTMEGYDVDLVKSISTAVSVPVIALGGAGKNDDLLAAYQDGYADAVAAGSLFVYQSIKRGVLLNYPEKDELKFERK